MKDLLIPVVGMGCEHCVTKINKAVSQLAGVAQTEVDLAQARMRVVFDQGQIELSSIRSAVQNAGYDLDLRAFDLEAKAPQPEHDCAKEPPRR